MSQLICHLIGDYVVQNHWMANTKTRSSFAALVHAATYTAVFLAITRAPLPLAIIGGTHFLIDRFRLARYWVEFWGVGCDGWVARQARRLACRRAIASEQAMRFNTYAPSPSETCIEAIKAEYAAPEPAPPFLAVWLLIIVDNTIHLMVNAAALSLANA